jgi:poly(3-hydroxybutyrate) depolymerase
MAMRGFYIVGLLVCVASASCGSEGESDADSNAQTQPDDEGDQTGAGTSADSSSGEDSAPESADEASTGDDASSSEATTGGSASDATSSGGEQGEGASQTDGTSDDDSQSTGASSGDDAAADDVAADDVAADNVAADDADADAMQTESSGTDDQAAADDGAMSMSTDDDGSTQVVDDDGNVVDTSTDDAASDDGSASDADQTSTDDADPGGDDTATTDDAGPPSGRLTAIPIEESGGGLGYWEYLPPNYGDEPLPLLVFTHGAAWQGAGTLETLQSLLEVGPPNLISTDVWPNDRPFIVLSPQNPRSGCFEAADIDTFYNYVVDNYDVDMSRIYHTGQSCGAIGAWNYLAEHLDEFVTAAVLISGDGQPAFERAGCDLGRIAIWGFHNELDNTVSSDGTINTINSLLECEPTPDVKMTIYEGETEHDAWTKTYDMSAGHDIYSWLLEHVHP